MRGQPIVAIQREAGKLITIGQVTQTGLKCDCICYDCQEALTAVLNTPYQKHFRHNHNLNCNPTPESQLHLMAKVIIEQNNRLFMPGKGMVAYTDPMVEIRCNDLVPDATITVDGQPVYVEIIVTNPLSAKKIQQYKTKQASVLVIHLGEEDREMEEDLLTYLVLEDANVRYMLTYTEEEVKIPANESIQWWGAAIVVASAAMILWKKYGRPFATQRNRRRR
ncbi:hypothetical protein [Mucilaginibacter ginsenosidivorans]|uniref:Uncharacterized protein n=1 Tax=Mucilaginibacter ginsenosidivorans TaxID=398053 RepID=A0A5B8UTI0_9SPHI|nr:hypothetical protein [Mucilaginibacter ginsenosidivorans]QEC62410.1 hypothetical protein FRZ54_07365 [Mucilaginibacter ginsenosidivorans]